MSNNDGYFNIELFSAAVVGVLANNIQRDHLQLGILLAVVVGEDANNGKKNHPNIKISQYPNI